MSLEEHIQSYRLTPSSASLYNSPRRYKRKVAASVLINVIEGRNLLPFSSSLAGTEISASGLIGNVVGHCDYFVRIQMGTISTDNTNNSTSGSSSSNSGSSSGGGSTMMMMTGGNVKLIESTTNGQLSSTTTENHRLITNLLVPTMVTDLVDGTVQTIATATANTTSTISNFVSSSSASSSSSSSLSNANNNNSNCCFAITKSKARPNPKWNEQFHFLIHDPFEVGRDQLTICLFAQKLITNECKLVGEPTVLNLKSDWFADGTEMSKRGWIGIDGTNGAEVRLQIDHLNLFDGGEHE